jgi:hypothetical protein
MFHTTIATEEGVDGMPSTGEDIADFYGMAIGIFTRHAEEVGARAAREESVRRTKRERT